MDHIFEKTKLYTALWRETNALYADWARSRGLSYYELLVILSLTGAGSCCTQKEICRTWQLPKQTVNTILRSLTERALVELSPAPEDRRNKIISLTPEGGKALGRIAADLQAHECAAWKRMGDGLGDQLIEAMMRFNQFFQEAGNENL